jgi:hypothetical protein
LNETLTCILFKVRLTPSIIFGMGNIWVILRRNVMYLYNKITSSWSTFSLSKFQIWCH